MLRLLCFLLFLFVSASSAGQTDTNRIVRGFGYPIVYYAPEPGFGLGAAGTMVFTQLRDSSMKFPSQLSLGASYTTKKQLVFYAPYRIYLAAGKIVSYGELSHYRFRYNFYGVGEPLDYTYVESYKTHFTRFRVNALYKLSKSVLAGPRFWLEDHRIVDKKEGGILDDPKLNGASGSRISGIGITVNIDTRDNLFFPRKGAFIELAWQEFRPFLGSSSSWNRWLADASVYHSAMWDGTLAMHAIGDFQQGEVPFMLLAGLGGGRRMRGYYENRFRDKNAVLLQAEYRKMLDNRLGFAVFASGGKVSEHVSKLMEATFRFSGGAGIRFTIDRKERLNLRLDFAMGRQSSGFYFQIGEAF